MIDTTSNRIIAYFVAAFVLAACGGEEATPADSISTSGDEDPSDPSATTNPSSTTPTETSADTTLGETTDEETTDDPSTTDDPTTGGPECLGDNDCWQCEPQNNTHVINGCTDAECEGFPNERRLPLLEPDGSLPPLP